MLEAGIAVAGWKTIKSLYEGYQNWATRNKKSKEAKIAQIRAEQLIVEINMGILSGKSSDDPALAPLIKEFRQLLAKDVKPIDADRTVEWIIKSGASRAGYGAMRSANAVAKPAAKKAAAKPSAKKSAAKPAAKKVAKPAAKKAAKPAAKKAAKPAVKKAAKPAAKKAAARPMAKKG